MKKLLLFYFIITLFFPGLFSQINNDTIALLHPDNIIKITFDNNDRIKSAYYELESAKYNFKLFESEYTQFNPLIVAPRINMNSAGQYSSDVVAGMQKEFFNGASISTAIGNNNSWGSGVETGNVNFVETEIGFPLFSSSRALERIMKRTFEENELYTKNLDYVEAVRENIKEALEMYYDLVPRIKTYEALKEYQTELKTILINDSTVRSGTDQEQIEGEITNLTSKITGWEITLYSLQLNMQLMMNVKQIKLAQLMKIEVDFSNPDYFGEYYIKEATDTIFRKALVNDTEFKVLGIIKKNAEEKMRLAEKGKWDIYATTGGRYNYYEIIRSEKLDNFFMADAGIKVKINDRKVLQNTVAKAQADINAIDYTIEDRRKLIQADILQLKDALTKKKEQMISTSASLKSWERAYAAKKDLYLGNQESIENLLQTFRSLVETRETFLQLENNYLDLIRDLDYVCGVYFTVINVQNNMT